METAERAREDWEEISQSEFEGYFPEPEAPALSPIEELQADNAALTMQVAQLEAKNEQQAGDVAFLILKNAELEAQVAQSAQEQASLLMELTAKGVL